MEILAPRSEERQKGREEVEQGRFLLQERKRYGNRWDFG